MCALFTKVYNFLIDMQPISRDLPDNNARLTYTVIGIQGE